jgi:hypothetical protein
MIRSEPTPGLYNTTPHLTPDRYENIPNLTGSSLWNYCRPTLRVNLTLRYRYVPTSVFIVAQEFLIGTAASDNVPQLDALVLPLHTRGNVVNCGA